MRPALILAAFFATAALAQPAPPPPPGGPPPGHPPHGPGPMLHGDTSKPADAGAYHVEPGHTQITFAVSHMGISPYAGWFSGASGSLQIDPAHPEAAKVSVTIPIASVTTTSPKLTDELKSPDWFDAARYPQASFVSSAVHVMGDGARIDGTLTLHGVERPATIHARLFGTATNAMSKAPSIGFVGRMLIRRSEFNVTRYIPLVSDEVELVINAAFEKDPAPAPSRK